ncbi:MAG: nitrate reductase cytochrome c-type subunit [Azoarcus sp.]|jgi:cytochrome c-type protein NapB|nr:nitrate reductase cytochrome c-type subunit [Azoarcus sp.]
MKNRLLTLFSATALSALLLSCAFFAGKDGDAADTAANALGGFVDDGGGGLATLRGAPIPASLSSADDALKKVVESDVLERDFTQQPPLVSHPVDDYAVTLNSNKCMDCHSWENYRREKATKVPQTHFRTADGRELTNLAARRYFCLQCHVPQIDAEPLIANTYQRPTKAR